MAIDDMPANLSLLENMLKSENYKVYSFPNGKMAINAALKNKPDLILLDINMPEMDGYEVCQKFKSQEVTADIPIIFISAFNETINKVKAFSVGGVDYVTKPFQFEELKVRLETHLKICSLQNELQEINEELTSRVREQVKEISEAQISTIIALAKVSESRDTDVGRHIERVQEFCKTLTRKLYEDECFLNQLTEDFIDKVGTASLLHDIGKVGIEDSILRKPGKLTVEEFESMMEHTTIGSDTLAITSARYPKNNLLQIGKVIARSHHERWDGRGYPDGLKGEAIPLEARIMALVDVYDALRSKRCYKNAISHVKSLQILQQSRETQFDPVIVDTFVRHNHLFERIYEEIS